MEAEHAELITDAEIITPKRPHTGGRKKGQQNAQTQLKHAAISMLSENGMKHGIIAESLGISPGTVSNVVKKMCAYDKNRERLLSSAVRTVGQFIKGQPVGGQAITDPTSGETKIINQVFPNSSAVMRAAESVLDREAPKIQQSVNLNLNADLDPIDLSIYKR